MPDVIDESDPDRWALQQLDRFIAAADCHFVSYQNAVGGSYKTVEPDDIVVAQWAVVEQILAKYMPDWRDRIQTGDGYRRPGYRWREQREGAQLCRAHIKTRSETARFLGESGPSFVAEAMHPWVWGPAKPAWDAGNFDDAVDAAARNLNGRLRTKVGRRDLSEGDLVAQVFSDKKADETNPRLRLTLDPSIGAKTEASIYGGIIAFGRGLFQAVRNPLAHEPPGAVQMSEQDSLECLAALSLLARWIDRATVHRS